MLTICCDKKRKIKGENFRKGLKKERKEFNLLKAKVSEIDGKSLDCKPVAAPRTQLKARKETLVEETGRELKKTV